MSESTESVGVIGSSPTRELAALRAEYEREVQARHALERRAGDAEELERALRMHLSQVDRLERQLSSLCGAVVSTISALLDARDGSTSTHSRAVADCAVRIAARLGLDDAAREAIRIAALLHDVGKIAVSDSLLHKPGPLTESEWQEMREHPTMVQRLLGLLPLPREAIEAIRHHHERLDGRGYPDGLAGEEIPLGARIIAVADAFHAMTSDRPYRTRTSPRHARAEIRRCAGSHFCPRVVEAFLAIAIPPDVAESAAA